MVGGLNETITRTFRIHAAPKAAQTIRSERSHASGTRFAGLCLGTFTHCAAFTHGRVSKLRARSLTDSESKNPPPSQEPISGG